MKKLFFLLLFLPAGLSAQISWQKTNAPGRSANFFSYLKLKDGTILAGDGYKTLYRSTDHGNTWSFRESENPSLAFVQMAEAKNGYIFATRSFLTSNEPLFRSIDKGITWTCVSGFNVSSFAIDSSGYIYCGLSSAYNGTCGIMRSTDYGNSWQHIDSGLTSNTVRCILVLKDGTILAAGLGIAISFDKGISWIDMNNGIIPGSDGKIQVSGMAERNGRVYASTRNGLYMCAESEHLWKQTKFSSFFILDSRDMTVDDSSYVYCATLDSLCRSTDHGLSWQKIHAFKDFISYLTFSDNKLIVGISEQGLLASSDHGRTWSPYLQYNKIPAYILSFAELGGVLFAGTSDHGLYSSTDYGQTWEHKGMDYKDVPFISVHDSTIYICAGDTYGLGIGPYAGGGTVYKSTDKGLSWVNTSGNLQLRFVSAYNGKLYALNNLDEGIYKYEDSLWKVSPATIKSYGSGGYYLKQASIAVDSNDILFYNKLYLYYYGPAPFSIEAFYKSLDGGQTIQYVDAPAGEIVCNENNHLFVTTSKGLIRSTDQFASFSKLTSFSVHGLKSYPGLMLAAGSQGSLFLADAEWNYWNQIPSPVSEYNSILKSSDNHFWVWTTNAEYESSLYRTVLPVSVSKDDELSYNANKFSLSQNYPNPFNPSTGIKYFIPRSGLVEIKVYDILGDEVTTLINGLESAGEHTVSFSGEHLSSGVYFCRIRFEGSVKTIKMVLLK